MTIKISLILFPIFRSGLLASAYYLHNGTENKVDSVSEKRKHLLEDYEFKCAIKK